MNGLTRFLGNRRFVHNWKVSLFSLICLVTFINLGIWQLTRAEEKRTFIADREAMEELPPSDPFSLADDDAFNGRPVRMTGHYDQDRILLLDNRVLDGSVGFEVHQVFVDMIGREAVINRGFFAMGRTRDELPVIPAVRDRVRIHGRIYRPDSEALMLADEALPESFPAIVQRVTADEYGLGQTMFPHVVRLDEGQPGALPRYWPETVMTVAQHTGYAIQWFAMALAVAIVWLFFSFQKKEDL